MSLIPAPFWIASLVVIKGLGLCLLWIVLGLSALGVIVGAFLLAIPTIHYVLKWFYWAIKYSLYFAEPDFPPQWTFRASWRGLEKICKYPAFWIPLSIVFAFIILISAVSTVVIICGGVAATFGAFFITGCIALIGLFIWMLEDF